ncbi:alpha-tocopherol transfer protein-like [Stegodyphus dumicola]|uniref:alpha-tocopherol transfer protein-like n=1 Tax=Stegodyphus dumicola TaxID=202533 RepID=UPI0015A7C734|nr:alpha-tocopherol transfer protein-like [Stegodyphus dumicola]XP_035230927.1 alpha-tocopherol transfer protein-like [Stegodyphus dumicola]XP_035230928.1 alpha-tocopherol transfer protein-like [Stegodyphus dumicola]
MSQESDSPLKEFLPLMCHTLPEKLRLKAKKELNETEENFRRGIQHLKDFILRKELPSFNDDVLLAFLRGAKFDMKKCEDRYKRYISMRYKIADLVHRLDEDKIRSILDSAVLNLLPYRDSEGRVIICSVAKAYDETVATVDELSVCLLCFLEFAMKFPATTVSGFNYITCARIQQFRYLYDFFRGYRLYLPFLLSVPVRLHRFEIINENTLVRWFYNILSRILPSKTVKKIHMHGELKGETMASLLKIYNVSLLPQEFGGTLGPINNDFYKQPFLKFMENMRSDNARFLKGRKTSFDLSSLKEDLTSDVPGHIYEGSSID